jgi:2-desacetyl-2-hydroxyethyl bacteriochlorophyllide A dehydrogenase
MWTSTLELSRKRVILTQLLGRFWHGAYFSSFAPLQVQNLPRQPLPASNWVRVRNHLAGICGSDLRLIYADGDFRIAPAALPSHRHSYPGHEVVGEVIEVGDDVQHLHVGDRVVLQSGPNCFSTGAQPLCRSCASGNYSLCERAHLLSGPEPIGGGWSEEMLLHEQQLFRISSEMSDEQAALLEPSAVAVHAVLRSLPQPGDHVLVIGAGTIGLLTLQVIRALVPDATVSVLARYPYQIELATRMGAAHILYPQDSYQGVERATGAKLFTGMFDNKMLIGGYEVIYDTIGNRETIHDSLRWARAGGAVVLIGLSLHTMHLDLTPIWYQEIDLVGTLGHGMETWPVGSHEYRSTFAIAAEMIESGQLHPEKLITHRFSLNNFREALSTAATKSRSRAIKVVFDYALLPASVVPNVRATARQRRPVTTTAARPQEQQIDQEESFVPLPPAEHFIEPASPFGPEPEPFEVPLTAPQSSMPEPEQPPSFSADEQLAFEDQSQTTTSIPEIEEPLSFSADEQPALEDQNETTTTGIAKPGRARKSTRSQKTTEDIPAPVEAIGNSAGTNLTFDTLEEE